MLIKLGKSWNYFLKRNTTDSYGFPYQTFPLATIVSFHSSSVSGTSSFADLYSAKSGKQYILLIFLLSLKARRRFVIATFGTL